MSAQVHSARASPPLTFTALVLLVASLVVLPAGIADTFTTYDVSDSHTESGNGTFHAEHSVSPGTGLIELYASATLDGGVDVIGSVGGTYVLNSGDLLAPFTAVTSTKGEVLGSLACPNFAGGTEASLGLSIKKLRQSGSNWIVEETAFVDEWRCPVVTVVPLEQFSGGGAFTYDPGATYRIIVEALARARAEQGSQAIVDFCASGTVECGVIPDHILVREIKIPNQGPVALFNDATVWYVDALLTRAEASGRGCDIDGSVREIRVFVAEMVGATVTPMNNICGDGQHFFLPLLPGTYTGVVDVKDDEGAVTRDTGQFTVSVLPPLAAAPVGFPALAQMTPSLSATVDAWLAPDGQVIAYRLVQDGLVVADTTRGLDLAGVDVARVHYDLVGSLATVSLNGAVAWSGAVLPSIDPSTWWDVRPAPAATGALP